MDANSNDATPGDTAPSDSDQEDAAPDASSADTRVDAGLLDTSSDDRCGEDQGSFDRNGRDRTGIDRSGADRAGVDRRGNDAGAVDRLGAIDSDGDGVVDTIDNCPHRANADQADWDRDGIGNVCDEDANNDGLPDDLTISGGGCNCTGGSNVPSWILAAVTLGALLRRRRQG
jgi:MYXO-CTERM domain-containing protein